MSKQTHNVNRRSAVAQQRLISFNQEPISIASSGMQGVEEYLPPFDAGTDGSDAVTTIAEDEEVTNTDSERIKGREREADYRQRNRACDEYLHTALVRTGHVLPKGKRNIIQLAADVIMEDATQLNQCRQEILNLRNHNDTLQYQLSNLQGHNDIIQQIRYPQNSFGFGLGSGFGRQGSHFAFGGEENADHDDPSTPNNYTGSWNFERQ